MSRLLQKEVSMVKKIETMFPLLASPPQSYPPAGAGGFLFSRGSGSLLKKKFSSPDRYWSRSWRFTMKATSAPSTTSAPSGAAFGAAVQESCLGAEWSLYIYIYSRRTGHTSWLVRDQGELTSTYFYVLLHCR